MDYDLLFYASFNARIIVIEKLRVYSTLILTDMVYIFNISCSVIYHIVLSMNNIQILN